MKRHSTLSSKPVVTPEPNHTFGHVQVVLGYVFVALSVAGGGAMFLFPRAFGLGSANPAPVVGLGVLALLRLLALHRQVRKQQREAEARPDRMPNAGARR